MRYAVVQNDTVVNVVIWNGEDTFVITNELVPIEEGSDLGIGWTLVDGAWQAPYYPPMDVPEG